MLEAPQEENSSNQAVVAILIIIGVSILVGIVVIIYIVERNSYVTDSLILSEIGVFKNKKNKKSGDTNEKDKEDLQ